MKGSQLVGIFEQGSIVIPLYFLQHFKKFKLKMEEFVFLMYLYHLGNHSVFDPGKFSEDLNMELTSVMGYIGILTEKKYIRVEVLKNDKGLMEEVIVLDEFYHKLSLMVMDEANRVSKSIDSTIFDVIEKEFGRTLSPIEYEIIKAWLDNDMSEELIKEAIKEATFNGVSNLRYIDKILYEWGKSGIKSIKDVERNRKRRAKKKEEDADINIDMDIVDWDWFDEDE